MDYSSMLPWTFSSMLPWTLIVLACIHVLLLVRKRVSSKGKLPPGPFPLPIVGNLLKLSSKANESFAQLAKTYGPLMTLKLGSVTTIVVSSSITAKEVLQKNAQAFAGRTIPAAMDGVRSYNSSSISGPPPNAHWKKLRTICNTQMFTSARLNANQGLRRNKVQDLVSHIHEHSLAGKPVEIGQAAFTASLNLIYNTVFSVDLVDPNSDSAQEFKDIVWEIMKEAGSPNVADFYPVLRPIDPQGIRRRTAAHVNKLFTIFDRMIAERTLSRSTSSDFHTRNDFLDVLLDQKDDVEFASHDMKPLLLDLFIAGSETSSTTVEWAMAELLRSPDCMEKARLELKKTIGSGKQVEESDTAHLPYLQAIVKETLRLHPPVPLIFRKTTTDVEISGFAIPKDTTVFVNVWAIGRDPDTWKDPSSFLPERFLGSDIDFKGQDFEFIPFGSGRRICPGMPLAFRTVHLMLASLLHSFNWKLPNGMMPSDMDMTSKFGMTMQLASPLRAIPMLDG